MPTRPRSTPRPTRSGKTTSNLSAFATPGPRITPARPSRRTSLRLAGARAGWPERAPEPLRQLGVERDVDGAEGAGDGAFGFGLVGQFGELLGGDAGGVAANRQSTAGDAGAGDDFDGR